MVRAVCELLSRCSLAAFAHLPRRVLAVKGELQVC